MKSPQIISWDNCAISIVNKTIIQKESRYKDSLLRAIYLQFAGCNTIYSARNFSFTVNKFNFSLYLTPDTGHGINPKISPHINFISNQLKRVLLFRRYDLKLINDQGESHMGVNPLSPIATRVSYIFPLIFRRFQPNQFASPLVNVPCQSIIQKNSKHSIYTDKYYLHEKP
jgi:hypothetical protein